MDVIRTIKPGQPGSVRFHRQYKDRLIAVRYRRDPEKNTVFTTVELVVNQRASIPSTRNPESTPSYTDQQLVAVRIAFPELELRLEAKKMGAQWSPRLKLWMMRYQTAVALGISDRVVTGA